MSSKCFLLKILTYIFILLTDSPSNQELHQLIVSWVIVKNCKQSHIQLSLLTCTTTQYPIANIYGNRAFFRLPLQYAGNMFLTVALLHTLQNWKKKKKWMECSALLLREAIASPPCNQGLYFSARTSATKCWQHIFFPSEAEKQFVLFLTSCPL